MKLSDEINHEKSTALLALAFLQFYSHNPARMLYIFVLMMIQGITAGVGLLFIIPFIEVLGILPGTQANSGIVAFAADMFAIIGIPITLINILVTYLIIAFIVTGIQYLQTVESSKLQHSYIYQARFGIFRDLLSCNWQFTLNRGVSEFVHTLTIQVQKAGVAMTVMLSILSHLSLTMVMFALALLISWESTLVAGLLAAFLSCVLLPLNKVVYASGKTQNIKFKSLFKMLTEQLSNFKIIKSYSAENYFVKQMNSTGLVLEQQNVKMSTINAITNWVFLFGAASAFALFIYLSQTYLSLNSNQILLFLLIVARMIPKISTLQKNIQQLLHLLPAFKGVANNQRRIMLAQECLGQTSSAIAFKEKLVLENIDYRYSNSPNNALNGIRLSILRDQIVALTGSSGAGKSTLVDIIAGLLSPTKGRIFCDGLAITESNRAAWRKNIAYVTQDSFLFNDTIEKNMVWACELQPSEEKIWWALEMAAAKDFVEAMPLKLQTEIGDRGIRVSGGERQRLGIARAILSGRSILILDEATSALDEDNENAIQETIKNLSGKITIIVIAHRESTLKIANRIVRLVNGRIQE